MCPRGRDTARGTRMASFSGLQAQTAIRRQPAQCVTGRSLEAAAGLLHEDPALLDMCQIS